MSMSPIEIIMLVMWIMRLLKALGFEPIDVKPVAKEVFAKKDEATVQNIDEIPDDVIEGLFKWA